HQDKHQEGDNGAYLDDWKLPNDSALPDECQSYDQAGHDNTECEHQNTKRNSVADFVQPAHDFVDMLDINIQSDPAFFQNRHDILNIPVQICQNIDVFPDLPP